MDISRRAFIQTTVAGGAALTAFGFDVTPVYAQAKTLRRPTRRLTTTDISDGLASTTRNKLWETILTAQPARLSHGEPS